MTRINTRFPGYPRYALKINSHIFHIPEFSARKKSLVKSLVEQIEIQSRINENLQFSRHGFSFARSLHHISLAMDALFQALRDVIYH